MLITILKKTRSDLLRMTNEHKNIEIKAVQITGKIGKKEDGTRGKFSLSQRNAVTNGWTPLKSIENKTIIMGMNFPILNTKSDH